MIFWIVTRIRHWNIKRKVGFKIVNSNLINSYKRLKIHKKILDKDQSQVKKILMIFIRYFNQISHLKLKY